MGIAIEVLPIGPVAVAARVWRHRGRRLFTAIVKATFALQHDGPMTILPPSPIVEEERHYRGNPVASLMHASDMALLVPKPEVVIVGSAYAGAGQTTSQTTVRLAVQRDSTILINKRLEIMGDRRAKPGATPPEPARFEKMPILYERARGGIAARDNPVGVGMAVDPDGLLTLPNINLPSQGGANPPGLGPIPSAWPLRQRKRGSLSWTAANLSPDVDVPNDFDDAYYQTAPSDQQTSELRPGDVIAIVNMHPDLGLLRTYLPNAHGVALAQTSRGDRLPLNLRIDTVHIEPDSMRAEIVFRGAAVMEESDLGDLRLAGAIEQPDSPFVFPDLSTVSGLMVARRSDAGAATPTFETTAIIAEPLAAGDRAAAARALNPSGPPPPPNHERVGHAGTIVMEPEDPTSRQMEPKAPVFGPPPAGVYAGPPSVPHAMRPPMESDTVDRRSTTAVIEPDAPKSLPFEKAHLKNVPTTAPSRDGTPWAVAPPHDLGFEPADESTVDAPTEKPITMEVPISSGSASTDVDSNAETPRRPTPAESPAAPVSGAVPITPPGNTPQPTPRTNLKRDLYKKLKR